MEVAPDERRGHPYRYGHHQGDSVIPDKAGLRACCNKRNRAGQSGPRFLCLFSTALPPVLSSYPSVFPPAEECLPLQPVGYTPDIRISKTGQVSRAIQSIALPDAAGPCLVCLRFLYASDRSCIVRNGLRPILPYGLNGYFGISYRCAVLETIIGERIGIISKIQ